MLLGKLVYCSAVTCGWAAFLGWVVAETAGRSFGISRGGYQGVLLFAGVVGAAIGAGLNLVANMTNIRWRWLLTRVPLGLLGGGVGGVVGGLIGNTLFVQMAKGADSLAGAASVTGTILLTVGWMVLGLGVGITDGVIDRSAQKMRNGAVGGTIGGLLGGYLFGPIASALGTQMSSRATGFVILGVCIGLSVGFVQVVFKEAWLTVMEGYRSGRILILNRDVEVLGRGDHLRLPFLGSDNRDLMSEHIRIVRTRDGSFALELCDSACEVRVRSGTGAYETVTESRILSGGDDIRFGKNVVRFEERRRRGAVGEVKAAPASTPTPSLTVVKPPPPPPTPHVPEAGSGEQRLGEVQMAAQPPTAKELLQCRPTPGASAPSQPRTPPPPPPPPPPPRR